MKRTPEQVDRLLAFLRRRLLVSEETLGTILMSDVDMDPEDLMAMDDQKWIALMEEEDGALPVEPPRPTIPRQPLQSPAGLSDFGKQAWEAIVRALPEDIDTHGCVTFHNPKEWAKTHQYGHNSVLIVSYGDRSAVAPFFSLEASSEERPRYRSSDMMRKVLEAAGFWSEECTDTYSAVYRS